jgi:microcystin-dependent protein
MDHYVAEIRPFAGTSNHIPQGWQLCDGTLLPISTYEVLFALLGTTFGGNGTTTFGVPDLRGHLPIGSGQGTGLTNRVYAVAGGAESVTLDAAGTPAHTHAFNVSTANATINTPSGNLFANPTPNSFYATTAIPTAPLQVLSADTVSNAGGGQAHENRMPTLAINYIIATDGIFPSQN